MASESIDDVDVLQPNAGGISVTRCRELLGEQAVDLSDEEIDAIRLHAHTMAQVLIEVLLDAPRA